MKVLIDTNVLVSAVLNPKGAPSRALAKVVAVPKQGIVCEQNIDELIRVFGEKFPRKLEILDRFLVALLPMLQVVPVPPSSFQSEKKIRDIDDRPILRAAIEENVDILLSGDKDFLESGIRHPVILSPSQFLEMDDGEP